MAPSAITTETEVETPSLPQTLKTRLLGAYKELAPVKYDKDVEEGKTALKAAKVRHLHQHRTMSMMLIHL